MSNFEFETQRVWTELNIALNHATRAWEDARFTKQRASHAAVLANETFRSVDRTLCMLLRSMEDHCERHKLPMPPQHERLARAFYDEDGEIRRLSDREDDRRVG